MTDIQQMQNQLTQALRRIQNIEDEMFAGKAISPWQYLVSRPHSWRRQLCIKGRNMTVGQLLSTVRANRLTPEQASDDLDLPLAAILEALAYHTANRELIELEAFEEKRRLGERGCPLEPKDLSR